MNIDLNCDLGEGEPLHRTRALMRCVTSANVACGGHAGTLKSMTDCARLARQHHVHLGAHPGLPDPDRNTRGREMPRRFPPDALELLLLQQVTALASIARANAVRLHHLKLHGALYHACETSGHLAERYVATAARWWPGILLYVRAGGLVARLARQKGVQVWEEIFADRAYREDGSLVPRGEAGAVLSALRAVKERTGHWMVTGLIKTGSGRQLKLRANTVCIHSDTPGAVKLARVIAQELAAR